MLRVSPWVEVSAIRDGDEPVPYTPLPPAVLTVSGTLRGTWTGTTLGVPEGTVEEAQAELDARARLLASGNGRTAMLVSLRANGEAHFLGGCGDQLFRPSLQRFLAIRAAEGDARSEAELLLSIVTDPDGDAGAELHRLSNPTSAPPVPWRDQPAERRLLDAAPAEVLATLESRTLVFHLPPGWQRAEVQLFTRIAGMGWDVGTLPQAAKGTVPLGVRVRPGSPVEVWLADGTRGIDGRHVHVLTIPYAAFASGEAHVYGAGGVASTADAWRLAARPGALLHR